MTNAHRRYLAIEAGIGAAINGVLSLGFVFLMFGRLLQVPVFGAGGLIVDAVPQSFMVGLMSALVPTLLTRRRVASGAVAPSGVPVRLPRHPIARAVMLAAAATVLGVGVQAAVLAGGPEYWDFAAVALGKTVYGMALGAVMTVFAARAALGDAA